MVTSTSSIGPTPITSTTQPPANAAGPNTQTRHAGRKMSPLRSAEERLGSAWRSLGSEADRAATSLKQVVYNMRDKVLNLQDTIKERTPLESRLKAGQRLKKIGLAPKGFLTQGELNAFPKAAEAYLSTAGAEARSSRALTKLKAKNASVFVAQVLGASGATAAIGAALAAIIVAIQSKPVSVEAATDGSVALPEMDISAAGFPEVTDPKLQASLEDLFETMPEPTRSDAITTFKEAYNQASPETRSVFIDAFVQACALEYLRAWEDPSLPVASYNADAQLIGAQLQPDLLYVIQQHAIESARQSAYDEAPSTQPNPLPESGTTPYAALGAALGAISGAGAGGLLAQTRRKNRNTTEYEVARRMSLEQKAKTEPLSPEERTALQHLQNKQALEKSDPAKENRIKSAESLEALKQTHAAQVAARQSKQTDLQKAITAQQ